MATFFPSSQNSTDLIPLPLMSVWIVCTPLVTPPVSSTESGTMRNEARVECRSSLMAASVAVYSVGIVVGATFISGTCSGDSRIVCAPVAGSVSFTRAT